MLAAPDLIQAALGVFFSLSLGLLVYPLRSY